MGINYKERLLTILPKDRVSTNETVLEQHSKDESFHPSHSPDVVVFPKFTEEISDIMKLANELEIPVVPFGIGSGLEGQVIPQKGGISIDFQLMNKILEINQEDLLVRVQPGVTRKQLNKELGKYGLFFSVDPGADASIGGMASTNASGTTAVRYGNMKENIRDLEVVLSDGRVIHTGNKAKKSSSGYQLTELFVGSEGTLGIFSEITLRIFGIPEAIVAGRAVFPSVYDAAKATVSALSMGISIARSDLIDVYSIRQINKVNQLNYLEGVTVLLEIHGHETTINQEVEMLTEIYDVNNCLQFETESDTKKRAELWSIRHNLFYSFLHHNPGKTMMNTDVCVPLSKIPDAVDFARKIIDKSKLTGTVAGHIGDGNFHAGLLINLNDASDMEEANKINEQIVEFALKHGGTCTGEHGVGLGKIKYQKKQHGEAYHVMKGLKEFLDPKSILNPGKIFEML